MYLYFNEKEAAGLKVEPAGRCPCGAVMGELGQNKQLPTRSDSHKIDSEFQPILTLNILTKFSARCLMGKM